MIRRPSHRAHAAIALAALLALGGHPAQAVDKTEPAQTTLVVTDHSGHPLAGAMVTVRPDARRRVTRFTDAAGTLDLATLPGAASGITVRYPGMTGRQISRATATTLALQPDPAALETLPSSAWLSLLPEGERKREFTVNCGTCHGLAHDRIMQGDRPRSADEWQAAIAMMRAMDVYEVIPPDFDDRAYAEWLAEHLSAERVATLAAEPPAGAAALAGIEITEYALPEANALPHDLVTGPDGRIWITAFFHDQLWALAPESGEVEAFPVDDRDAVNAQPRALEFDDRGTLWLVNGGTESVLRFDPDSGAYTEIPVGMYAHSIDIGPGGDAWVNDYFAAEERIARIAAADNAVTVIAVPPARRPAAEGLPLPYGLQVDTAGRLYSTQLAANTLVRYDTETGQGALYEMPAANSGPRRPGLDSRQRLWIPEFNTGHLALFDPATERFERIRLGSSSIGLYDVEVNQATDEVWATGSLASTLIRYTPDSGAVLTVPLPTEPAYTRHIAVDEASGDVWTAYSSLPPATPRIARLRFIDRD